MITYNNIVTKFEEFVKNHLFLKTFTHGSPADVDLDKFVDYPLLHLVYVGGNYANNVKQYNLEVYILDAPVREENKTAQEKSVISATEQAAEDILADIENGGNIFQFGYEYEIVSANINPLENQSTNILAGSLLTLSIGVAYTYDSCNAPITGVEAEGSPPPSFSSRGVLRVKEIDGSPDVMSVGTIQVPKGTLTDNTGGNITLDTASRGQQTIWKGLTGSGAEVTFAAGITSLDFGLYSSGQLTNDAITRIRAGWAIGTNPSGAGLISTPVTGGSAVTMEVKYTITLDSAGAAYLTATSAGGLFPSSWAFTTYTAAGTYTETVTATVDPVSVFSTSNTFTLKVVSTVPGTARIIHTQITIDHA